MSKNTYGYVILKVWELLVCSEHSERIYANEHGGFGLNPYSMLQKRPRKAGLVLP